MELDSLYEFQRDDAYRFRSFIGEKTKERGNELIFWHCPYCHGGSKKDRETFAINLDTGAFNCKRSSCGMTGNMITLAKDFDFRLSDDVTRYLHRNQYGGKTFRRFEKTEINSDDHAVEFMKSRGISEAVCKKYEITTKKDNNTVIAFPFKDDLGNLVFVKYRNTDPERIEEHGKEFCERGCKPILFGMNHCNTNNKTLIITEGQIDSLSVAEAGIENAVSVPTGAKGFTWVPYCVDWMEQFERIIVFGDYENGKITLLDDIKRRFHRSKQICYVDVRDYKDCKDANDILRKYGPEQIRRCIENAVPVPINFLKDLSEVRCLDPDDVERVTTGIYSLDYLLDGGLPVGMVTLINGRTGEGKSTLANQMAMFAKNAGKKILIYSGELGAEFLKSQIMLQIAGPDFVEEYESFFGKKRSRVKNIARQRISDWLNGSFIYDSTSIPDGDEREELVKVIEKSIQQYGINYVVIDNLMTAVDLESSNEQNKYDRQGEFVNKLARIALEFEIVIVLVAHRRKSNGFSQNENDEVLGSSQVTNLIGVNIFYGKATDAEVRASLERKIRAEGITAAKEISDEINNRWSDARARADLQRLIKVTKNRLTGECNMRGIVADFHDMTRRIYVDSKNSNLYETFGWADPSNRDFEDIADYETIPFDV